jgi:hypothetical protein
VLPPDSLPGVRYLLFKNTKPKIVSYWNMLLKIQSMSIGSWRQVDSTGTRECKLYGLCNNAR